MPIYDTSLTSNESLIWGNDNHDWLFKMDDLPPLDDASELVEKIKSRHAEKKSSENESS